MSRSVVMRHLVSRAALVVLALSAPISLAIAGDDTPPPAKKALYVRPNLAAAQKLAAQALVKLDAAQQASEYDRDGHAQKARDLLKQANDELRLAAAAADARKR
ncbi:MAG: hypothetical protein H0T89_32840 [Deltaproteobacteria bacterium]|nr:hypothetical protein [Deltaproteobacteria bacterium]MDQ3300390.1 hypothetical protein [Myxococcota bacterium]